MNKINKVFFLKISSSLHLIFQIYHIEANSMITLYKDIMKRIISCSIRSQSFIWEMLKFPSFCKNELAFQSLFYLSWRFENVTTGHLLHTSPHFSFLTMIRRGSELLVNTSYWSQLCVRMSTRPQRAPSFYTASVKDWRKLCNSLIYKMKSSQIIYKGTLPCYSKCSGSFWLERWYYK